MTVNKKKPSRPVKKLISIKRRFKKEYNSTKEEDLIKRRKLINRHIYESMLHPACSGFIVLSLTSTSMDIVWFTASLQLTGNFRHVPILVLVRHKTFCTFVN